MKRHLNNPKPKLNSFILSGTPFNAILNLGGKVTQADLEGRHVLFMEAGRDSYLGKLFAQIDV